MLEETNLESISKSDFEANPDLHPTVTLNSYPDSLQSLQALLEAIILAAGKPISLDDILKLFIEDEKPSKNDLRQALKALQDSCETRGVALIEMASGYQFQVKLEWAPIIARLWEEKAPRYSRALFETLALIAYRQPITRGEIEEIRGVSLSLSIFKTLLEEREWIRVVGHREVPGKPALYATTKYFLDYFGLKSLEELPSLPEIMNLDSIEFPEIPMGLALQTNHEKQAVASETDVSPQMEAEIESEVKEDAEEDGEEEIGVQIESTELLESTELSVEIEPEFQEETVCEN